MKNDSSYKTRKYNLHHLTGLALVLSLSGCLDDLADSGQGAVGGAPNANSSGQGGNTQMAETGGDTSTAVTVTGGASSNAGSNEGTLQASTGGASQLGSGGAAQVSTGGVTFVATGGAAQVSTGGAAEASTGGAAQVGTGGAAEASTGGASQTGGAAPVSAGGTAEVSTSAKPEATGGASQAGTGGAAQVSTGGATQVTSSSPDEPLCFDESGATVPYDFSIGLMGEYAYELSMSCEVGGYLMPLVMADPEQLSEVNAFVTTATDWYRADILNCKDATTTLDQDGYGLLPISQSADLSDADFDASLALFTMVLDRHDGQLDAVSAEKKAKIKNRIKSVKARAVHGPAASLTKTLPQPDCVPAAGAGG